jgi:hypothetical protein
MVAEATGSSPAVAGRELKSVVFFAETKDAKLKARNAVHSLRMTPSLSRPSRT